MSKYDEAVRLWAANQTSHSRYSWDSKTEKHLDGKDKCRLDPATVRNVTYDALESGGCDTCSFSYAAVTFDANCVCGKVKNQSFEISGSQHMELPDLIEEIMQFEPVTIEEHPV